MAWYTVEGMPVRAGGFTITPRSHILTFRVRQAGFAWQTPTSVLVERDGTAHRLRIVDVSRIGYWTLLLLAFLAWRVAR